MTYKLEGAPVAYVYVADRDRARAFYCDTLGLELRSSDGFGDTVALDGAVLRLVIVPDHQPGQHPVLGWDVGDIVAAVHALRDQGVVFAIYEGFGQDELGIWASPDGKTKLAFFSDPDGNALTLSEKS